MLTKLMKYALLPGALVAAFTLWTMLGLPTVALSTDIKRLDRQQVQNAVQIYNDRVRSLLSVAPPSDPVARQNWEEQLNQARSARDAYTKRQIEMAK